MKAKQKDPFRFGRTVRKARRRIDLTQRELAEASNVTPSFVSQIEAGQQLPQPKCIVLIAHRLGIDPLRMLRMARPDDYAAWTGAISLRSGGAK